MKVSVALCCFNGEKYIDDQIGSILQQTLPVDEVIICDDCSTDSTRTKVEEWQKKYYPVIKIFTNKENLGVKGNFEKAIEKCTGDIILLSDQDDVWMKDKVKNVVEYFNRFPSKLAVFSNAELINEDSENVQKTIWKELLFQDKVQQNPDLDVFEHLLLYRNVITGACLAFKRDAVQFILPFTANPAYLHDEWIGLVLGSKGKIGLLNEPLIKYRIHSNQVTKSIWNSNNSKIQIRRSILENNFKEFPLEHYRHWKKKHLALQKLKSEGLQINPVLLNKITRNKKAALLEWLSKHSFLSRKKYLLNLWLKRQEKINVLDFLIA